MNLVKCGDILISKGIEFTFSCIKCTNVYESLRDYQVHLLEEHIREIFGENFNEHLEIEFKEDASNTSDAKTEESSLEKIEANLTGEAHEALIPDHLSMENLEEAQDELDFEDIILNNNKESSKRKVNNKERLKCNYCDKTFDANIYHQHKKRAKCGICPLCEQSFIDIWGHISKFHKEYYQERKKSGLIVYERQQYKLTKEFFCEYCERIFKKEEAFKQHVLVHQKSLDKCKFCGKLFKDKHTAATHIRTHTGERPFKCPHCLFAFSDNTNLKRHIIIKHTAGLNVKCRYNECGKIFKTKPARNRHESYVHEDKRNHLCLVCGMSFKTSSKLSVHTKTKHMKYEERQFHCTYCDKRFVFNRDFVIHMTVHTGEKPHKCEICSKAFRKKYSLNEHKRKNH